MTESTDMNGRTGDLDWSGLPDGWDIVPLRSFVQGASNGVWGDPPSGDTDDVFCARVADFDRVRAVLDLSEPTVRSVSFSQRQNRLLHTGDLLLEKSGGGEKQPVGFVVLVEDLPGPTVCSNFVARMPVSETADPRFVRYLHQCFYSMRVNTRHIKQTTGIQNLDSASYRRETAPSPPLPIQRAIAAFLDRETAKIDALIEKKRRLLDLLDEKRTALITRAVTHGVDPDVPMKDSGVEWLGEIPVHWEVVALRWISQSYCDGPFGSNLKSEHYRRSGVRVIRLQNIGSGEFRNDDAAFIAPAHEETLGDHRVRQSDLLVAGLGDERHPVGRACVAPAGIGLAIVKADCFRFRLNTETVLPQFLAHQLSATAEVSAGALSTGATRSRMNLSIVAGRRLALPPLSEQHDIVRHVSRGLSTISKTRSKTHHAISLLQEYRTALISAAVTGQIDVSEAAA